MKKKDGSFTISQLPEHILQHILCFLPQNDAVQTSVLSKSWRNLWSTRSKIEFFNNFRGSEHQFLSVVDNTLQLYHDKKVSLQDLAIGMMMTMVDSESISISLLEKWIPIIAILNKGKLVTFTLLLDNYSDYFDLPYEIIKLESLRKLHLKGCKLTQINPLDELMFKQLKSLHLNRVYITDATLEKIVSSCPLIDSLALCECEGLTSTMKMREHLTFLKYFEFSYWKAYGNLSIEIDVPTLETIVITECRNWIRHDKYFLNLKSLCLSRVQLRTDLFDSFSCNFPCVEEMKLHFCYGFRKFNFQSVSIKRLIIEGMEETVNADIDAPTIVEFKYKGRLPWSISFTTSSKEWKSNINLDLPFNCSSWVVRLSVLLQGLSQSEISLDLAQYCRGDPEALVVPRIRCYTYTPIVVEHLHLRLSDHSAPNLSAFISTLCCICRPRKIYQFWCANAQGELERKRNQIIEFLYNILQMERKEETRQYSWEQDLEEVSLEEFDDIDEKWHHVHATSWLEYCASLLPKDFKNGTQQLRFRLKWREISSCLTN